jgi:hypothetical protein
LFTSTYESGRTEWRHGARVLRVLVLAQPANLLDAHHRPRILVGAVFLVAVDGEAFLSESWNQSRQVTRLPVQLWKYSCAITRSTAK